MIPIRLAFPSSNNCNNYISSKNRIRLTFLIMNYQLIHRQHRTMGNHPLISSQFNTESQLLKRPQPIDKYFKTSYSSMRDSDPYAYSYRTAAHDTYDPYRHNYRSQIPPSYRSKRNYLDLNLNVDTMVSQEFPLESTKKGGIPNQKFLYPHQKKVLKQQPIYRDRYLYSSKAEDFMSPKQRWNMTLEESIKEKEKLLDRTSPENDQQLKDDSNVNDAIPYPYSYSEYESLKEKVKQQKEAEERWLQKEISRLKKEDGILSQKTKDGFKNDVDQKNAIKKIQHRKTVSYLQNKRKFNQIFIDVKYPEQSLTPNSSSNRKNATDNSNRVKVKDSRGKISEHFQKEALVFESRNVSASNFRKEIQKLQQNVSSTQKSKNDSYLNNPTIKDWKQKRHESKSFRKIKRQRLEFSEDNLIKIEVLPEKEAVRNEILIEDAGSTSEQVSVTNSFKEQTIEYLPQSLSDYEESPNNHSGKLQQVSQDESIDGNESELGKSTMSKSKVSGKKKSKKRLVLNSMSDKKSDKKPYFQQYNLEDFDHDEEQRKKDHSNDLNENKNNEGQKSRQYQSVRKLIKEKIMINRSEIQDMEICHSEEDFSPIVCHPSVLKSQSNKKSQKKISLSQKKVQQNNFIEKGSKNDSAKDSETNNEALQVKSHSLVVDQMTKWTIVDKRTNNSVRVVNTEKQIILTEKSCLQHKVNNQQEEGPKGIFRIQPIKIQNLAAEEDVGTTYTQTFTGNFQKSENYRKPTENMIKSELFQIQSGEFDLNFNFSVKLEGKETDNSQQFERMKQKIEVQQNAITNLLEDIMAYQEEGQAQKKQISDLKNKLSRAAGIIA